MELADKLADKLAGKFVPNMDPTRSTCENLDFGEASFRAAWVHQSKFREPPSGNGRGVSHQMFRAPKKTLEAKSFDRIRNLGEGPKL